MADNYKIAVIGAGPGGLSAAAHAAELGESHVLLEASPKIANTIQKYQKGKHVMAEPGILPLRSPVDFSAGTREAILSQWQKDVESLNVNIQYKSAVTGIEGGKGNFTLSLQGGKQVIAESVILGIGLQGNPRKLSNIENGECDLVQYTLDDPDEYQNETIVVIGAGDAAIENALALSAKNKVYIVNRRSEFARAKENNLNLITQAIERKELQCFYDSTPDAIQLGTQDEFPGVLVLKTASGEAQVPVNRIIARLGAIPPRGLVESFGIEFPNDDPTAIPKLTQQYESNVPGIYVIGALGGYPLIKQAMNQGYEVVEYILGNDIEPADHPLLEDKFKDMPFDLNVDETLSLIQSSIPIFSEINPLLFRELMLDSQVHVLQKDSEIFKRNDYSNSFYTVLDGQVRLIVGDIEFTSKKGDFFGELSLISGRRRSATAIAGNNCVLIETPRRTMNKLITSIDSVKRTLDETFILRTIQNRFAANVPLEELAPIASQAKLNQYQAKEALFEEGEDANSLHLIRSGSVTVAKEVGGKEIPMSYVAANNVVGEMGLLGHSKRSATVRAAVRTETISIDSDSFYELLEKSPGLREQLEEQMKERFLQNAQLEANKEAGDLLSFLMQQGLGEATDVLLINEDACVSCDNCETACAATHGGTSRLNRKAGPTFAHVHVPTSCRHCEDPSCMKDCPPDAIHRGGLGGEVYIDDSCIGCGNCEVNCPYGVIQMAYPKKKPSGFWQWMLTGKGPAPGNSEVDTTATVKKAVKCDMCKDVKGGAACVRACPTGAAQRISPEDFIHVVNK
ncbi:MAG: cyclic nucleotide-binding domain-containing protein [Aestuariibacter sp.]